MTAAGPGESAVPPRAVGRNRTSPRCAGRRSRLRQVACESGSWSRISASTSPCTGPTLTFRVRAVDDSGRLVADGEIDRAIVNRERFLGAATRA
ncbi:hypothetical protein GCM10023336_72920 [Streptomyces similanensis]|uniref:Thioesterase domain-containing protein n=1 Tax=Streptomyces similanensis TaxID=1274988 RepID=A0ABP9LMR6_9ACTN